MEQKVQCTFANFGWEQDRYSCRIEEHAILSKATLNLLGKHLIGKSNADVQEVSFLYCQIQKIPHGLTKIFPNMKYLEISSSELTHITRDDLKEYTNLKGLWLSSNNFAFIPGDLLEDLTNLESLSLDNSKIKVIEPNIFDSNRHLTHVDLRGNICIDRMILFFKGNDSKEAVKNELQKQYPEWAARLKNFKVKVTSDTLKLMKEIHVKEKHFLALKQENKNLIHRTANTNHQMRELVARSEVYINNLNQKLLKVERKLREVQISAEGIEKDHDDLKQKFEGFEVALENDDLKDFTIRTKNEEFKAHKFVLATRSPAFETIFKENIHAECLNLVNIPTKIFRIILDFIYTNQFPQSDEINFINLFKAADRFQIEKLRNFAAQKLINQVNMNNALIILTICNKCDYKELQEKAFEAIKTFLECETIDDKLATQPEILKKLIEMQTVKKEMLRNLEEKFKSALEPYQLID